MYQVLTTELPSSDSQLQSTDTGTPKPSETDRLAQFRKALSENEISEEAGEMLTASWRQGTNKNYDSAWRKWESCKKKGVLF